MSTPSLQPAGAGLCVGGRETGGSEGAGEAGKREEGGMGRGRKKEKAQSRGVYALS